MCGRFAAIAIKVTGAAILLTRSENGMSLLPRRRKARASLSQGARSVRRFRRRRHGRRRGRAGPGGEAQRSRPPCRSPTSPPASWSASAARRPPRRPNFSAKLGAGNRGLGGAPGALALAEAKTLREQWSREGLTVGFTNGCFDILHAGHVSLLRQAAAACDRLIVALNTDASVRAPEGRRAGPVQPEDVRAAVMAAMKGVDAVILFGEADAA